MRPQSVVLPLLRADLPGVSVVSEIPDVDHRTLPMVWIRRAGGTRNPKAPTLHSRPELDIAAVSAAGLVEAEELYEDVLDALYEAVSLQVTIPGVGYLQSLKEAQGATQSLSPFPDSWSVEGSVRVGLRT